ncbi:aminodeoxychorismate synthase component I [Ekhidna sp. To15]|uniref:aminodeoxychorismate synthase component I n=1 Tax=Ekhidna sp. To15 TaxID=3395267 RepID=UPI003F51B74E
MLTKSEAILKLNKLGAESIPFSFYCDFLGENWCIQEDTSETSNHSFQLAIEDTAQAKSRTSKEVRFTKQPITFKNFKRAFDQVIEQINIGNSFLTNLTFETPIETNLSLEEIFQYSHAKFKLLVSDQFVVFSPETFVKIQNDHVYSYPMKGTIDADIVNAEKILLEDIKERAEHVTIVDLIRNDLSQVANKVEVTKFRYVDKLETNDKKLLQVSSEIKGTLESNWKENMGSILTQLLPAGSISGAPKPETIKIIKKAENYDRGFYTGICGHFDGESLNTGVMIRFIKKENGQLFYCSGGGITSFSEAAKEYQEMMDKVYLPVKKNASE